MWQAANAGGTWNGWLPHLDLEVARGFTIGSSAHDLLFKCLKRRGKLTLRTKLDLWQMLRASTQPDSKLDFEYPPEKVTVVLSASSPLELKVGDNTVSTGERIARITTQPQEHRWLPMEVTFVTGGGQPKLGVSWFTAEDAGGNPILWTRNTFTPAASLEAARAYLADNSAAWEVSNAT